jgi:hypothetical protein
MKKIIVFILFFFNAAVFSQNDEKKIELVEKTIVLKDVDTELPIQDATVFITKTKQSLLSNEEGIVSFILNGISNIQITHSSYNSVKFKSNFLKQKKNIIYLKTSVTGLDEIIITKQHPQKILKDIVNNSIDKLTIPGRLKVYSREFFKLNGTNTYYNDGLMNFQLFGTKKKLKQMY